MIYVYAIADRPEAPLPSQLGLRDACLSKIIWRDLVAVVSRFEGAELAKTADALWRHEEVLEALMKDRAVLPVRFGTLLPLRRSVSDMVCRAYRTLVQDLDRVRGHVEIGLRFLTAEYGDEDARAAAAPVQPAMGPGSAYLQARLAKERAIRDRQRAKLKPVREVYEVLAGHAHASRLDDARDDRHGASAAFLVPRDHIASFQGVIGDVAHAHPELALLCTGPWPPYSFVNTGGRATDWSEYHDAE